MASSKVEPVVSADWLIAHLGDPGLQVVDGTTFTPGEGRDAADTFREARIPAAIYFDINAIADPAPGPPMRMLPGPDQFAREMGALGLRPDAHIVAYDFHGLYSAARIWWMLRIYGCEKVSVLDGGLPAWRAAGGPVESGEPSPVAPTQWPVRPRIDLVRGWKDVLAAVEGNGVTVVDVRPAAMFNGDTSHIYPGVRPGHIPGSVNISQRDLRNADGRFKSDEEIVAIMRAAGVDPHGDIIASCGSGVTACILSLALDKVRGRPCPVYDGSWEEWGGRMDLPVAID